MSMTLWLHTLVEREYSQDSDDHTWMYRFYTDLDDVCESLEVAKLSSFFDYSDLEFGEELDENPELDEEDFEPDPETGLAYGLDEMGWFAADEGLKTLLALQKAVAENVLDYLPEEDNEQILQELQDCIETLQRLEAPQAQFHLAIIQ